MGSFFLISLLLIGVGVLAIFVGKNAIKTKRMNNSLKSSIVTGISRFEGDNAVKMEKLNIVLGSVFLFLGILGLVLSFVSVAFA